MLFRYFLISVFIYCVAGCSEPSMSRIENTDKSENLVVLETSVGTMTLKLDTVRAPKTSAYFLSIVDAGLYNGATFYRSASLDEHPEVQLIQGGILVNALTQTGPISASQFDMPVLQDIESTDQTGIRHQRGILSFARDLLDTGVVIPELVIYLRDASWADQGVRTVPDDRGFPAFGTIIDGMDVVEVIAQQDTKGATSIDFLRGQILTHPIVIERAYRAP